MSSVDVRSRSGDVVGSVDLDPQVFGGQVNVPVMHQVVVAQMAARRSGTHDTKTRGEVRGGGKKPYRQKGTGRARQGSIRAPHYSGGGVVWGPHPRDYSKKVPRKMRALALRSALTDRANDGKVVVVEDLGWETPRTKDAVALLANAGLEGTVLVVVEEPNDTVWRSFRNLPRAHVITVEQLNTYDVLARDWVLFTRAALDAVHVRTDGKKTNATASDTADEAPAAVAAGEGGEQA